MLVVLIVGALLVLGAFVLRNALALGMAGAAAWAVWSATRDVAASCAAAMAALCLATFVLELGAACGSRLVRGFMISAELTASVSAAALLAFMLFHQGQSPLAFALTLASASLIACGLVLRRRQLQR